MRFLLGILGGVVTVFAPLNLAQAIVFFSQGNDFNTTSPAGSSLPWNNVVQMRSDTGPIGSGVYLGNRYVLTAAHVGPLASVRIGVEDYTLDLSSAVSIDTADMKLVRLINDPGLGSVRLNTIAASVGEIGTVVGYGVGRYPSSPLNSSPVNWGDDSTVAKRWGTNTVDAADRLPHGLNPTYTSNLLRTHFSVENGANEVALTRYDSGSALFRQIESNWYLAGLGVAVENNGSSYASTQVDTGHGFNSDYNYFVEISSYASATNQMGGVVVPEPASFQFLMGGLLFLALLSLRKKLHPKV